MRNADRRPVAPGITEDLGLVDVAADPEHKHRGQEPDRKQCTPGDFFGQKGIKPSIDQRRGAPTYGPPRLHDATVTLLISYLGGWFSGTLVDRFGRVRMLQITILWYSVFTFLCAFAQNFEQLFVLRALHGLGFGGEWAAGAVLMGEVIRDKYRGRGVGIVQTGWAVGWGASALVYTALYAFLPEEIAWRVLFAIGLLPAVFVFWIRRHIEEPEIFRDRQRERPTVGLAHLFSAFRGPHLWTTVKVSLMVAGAQGGGYALAIWMPTYLRTVRGLSAPSTGGFLLVQILGALIGFLI